MFDNNKMAQYLMAGRKPVKEEADVPVSGLVTLSEAFKKIDADKEADKDE